MRLVLLLTALTICASAQAQNITWKNVGANGPAPMQPMQPFGGTSYMQQGNNVITNDGRAYQRHGNTTYGTDGSTAHQVGDTIYLRSADGSTKRCTKYGENIFCN